MTSLFGYGIFSLMTEKAQPQLSPRDNELAFGNKSTDTSAIRQTAETQVQTVDTMRPRIEAVLSSDARERLLNNLGEVGLQKQIVAISKTAAAFQNGETAIPSAFDYVSDTVSRYPSMKNSLGVHHLRGIISTTLIPARERNASGELTESGVQKKIASRLNNLRTFLGGDEAMIDVVANLSDVEQALLLDSVSTAQKCLLRYPDAEVCDEDTMSRYLSDAIYGKHGLRDDDEGGQRETFSRIEMFDRVEQLITVISERSETRTIDVPKVLSQVMRPPYNETTLRKIILVASYTGQLDLLEDLFLQCYDTHKHAQLCRQVLDGGGKVREPEWMKEANQFPRRS